MERQSERHPVFLDIVLESASGRRDALVSNIGTGGCFINTAVEMQPGEPVSFEIKGQPGIIFTGNVVYHSRSVGFGIAFQHLDPEAIQYLWQHLLKHRL